MFQIYLHHKMFCSNDCYTPCTAPCPQPTANSCNDPCVRQCSDSTVVIYPPPIVMSFPDSILSSCPQGSLVGFSGQLELGVLAVLGALWLLGVGWVTKALDCHLPDGLIGITLEAVGHVKPSKSMTGENRKWKRRRFMAELMGNEIPI